MVKRVAAIAFIFVCTSIAWAILGGTIFSRTYSFNESLKQKVGSIWGTAQVQAPPTAEGTHTVKRTSQTTTNGRKQIREWEDQVTTRYPLETSRVDVAFNLEHRQKGLLWYSTYKVAYAGQYTFRNTSTVEENVRFALAFPAAQAIYDDLVFQVDGKTVSTTNDNASACANVTIPAGKTAVLRVGYRSQGLDRWTYKFDDGVAQVRDFVLNMHTDFTNIDFPESSLSPTEKRPTASGWDLTWRYTNLVSGLQIGMVMPQKLQPGPLAAQISYFAPVSLLFFFFVMFIITTLRNIDLHPMNYFFLAAAFFAFHLLMAYLADHLDIHLTFLICSAVSIILVVSYLRLVVGIRFALVEAGIAQFVYLVLFSYAFFFQGFTGLAVTVGAIVTLFVAMQVTGKVNWSEKFAAKRNPMNGESWVKG